MSVKILLKYFLDARDFLEIIKQRFSNINSYEDFTNNNQGVILLDSIAMRLQAIGEIIKKISKINPQILEQNSEIDWKGVINFRDKISHHYVDIDAEEIYFICKTDLPKLEITINKIISDLEKTNN